MAKKGSLFINIGARVGGFKKGLNKTVRMLRGYKNRIAKMMPKMPGGALGALGLGVGLAGMMGILQNASPKFAKAVTKVQDVLVGVAAKVGDKLAPVITKIADKLPEVIDKLMEWGAALAEWYGWLQGKMEKAGEKAGEAIGKALYGDASGPITKEELEVQRQIRDELKAQGKSGNASAVDNQFRKGQTGLATIPGMRGIGGLSQYIAESIME